MAEEEITSDVRTEDAIEEESELETELKVIENPLLGEMEDAGN